MKKFTLWISVVSLMVFSGCSNVTFLKAREGCNRGVGVWAWDICEDIKKPVATTREDIRGDEYIGGSEMGEEELFLEQDS